MNETSSSGPASARERLPDSSSPSRIATGGRPSRSRWRQLSPRVIVCDADDPGPPPVAAGTLCLAQRSIAELGTVFGDGSHPTTRLCAGAVDVLCRQRPLAAVLDVGTGTGVLARIARARGAAFVAGTDIDAHSIVLARLNAALDADAAPIHFGDEAPDRWGPRFDLVVANILAEPLVELAPRLARALSSGGQLLISGFTRPQSPALRRAFEAEGLLVRREAMLDEWLLLMFNRPAS